MTAENRTDYIEIPVTDPAKATRSKQAWTELPAEATVFEEFYDLKSVWCAESLQRLRENIESTQAASSGPV